MFQFGRAIDRYDKEDICVEQRENKIGWNVENDKQFEYL